MHWRLTAISFVVRQSNQPSDEYWSDRQHLHFPLSSVQGGFVFQKTSKVCVYSFHVLPVLVCIFSPLANPNPARGRLPHTTSRAEETTCVSNARRVYRSLFFCVFLVGLTGSSPRTCPRWWRHTCRRCSRRSRYDMDLTQHCCSGRTLKEGSFFLLYFRIWGLYM